MKGWQGGNEREKGWRIVRGNEGVCAHTRVCVCVCVCVCVYSYALGRESKKSDSLARQQNQEPLINYKAQANAYSSLHLSRHCPSFLINALLVGG